MDCKNLFYQRIARVAAASAALAILLVGCNRGEELWPVAGRITFQGKPVTDAAIRFSNPQAGVDLMAKIGPEGTYTVVMAQGSGMPPGTYQVAVIPNIKETPLGPIQQAPKPPERPDIPLKYRRPNTSGLTLTVPSDAQRFDFDMQP